MHRGKIGIILEARMGSTRLPGKVLKLMAGRPLIQWIIERLQKSQKSNVLVLATSMSKKEKPLVDFVNHLGIPVYRGSELDVLDRYYQCAKEYRLDHIVRATGDNPFVDTEECDRLIEFYLINKLDYATSFPQYGSGLPVGVGLEIFRFSSLERSWREAKLENHREHVNEYIQENSQIFKQATLKGNPEKVAANLSLTVDTLEDLNKVEHLYLKYLKDHSDQHVSVKWVIENSNN